MHIRIVQQNISKDNHNVERLIGTLLEEEQNGKEQKMAHGIFFSEFCYSTHKVDIVKRLEDNGYQIFMPFVYDKKKHSNWKGVCMLAVKHDNNIKEFIQRERKDIILDLRYIEGSLELTNGESIEMFFTYVPQTCVTKKKETEEYSKKEIEYYQDRVEEKANMLFNAYIFWQEYKDRNALLGGDINVDIAENSKFRLGWLFKKIYDEAIDTDIKKDNTWGNKRLDYALVSKSLTDCETIQIGTTSDHKALKTSILTPFTKKGYGTIGSYFNDGGKTYTREELENKLYSDLGIDKRESNKIINKCVTEGWIIDCGNDVFVR